MMVKGTRYILTDEKAVKLNEPLIMLLSDLKEKYYGLEDDLLNLVVDEDTRNEKDPFDLLNNPEVCLKYSLIQDHMGILKPIIDKLHNTLYSGEEEILLNKKRVYLKNPKEMREWLGINVKPLILDGETLLYKWAEITGKPKSNISTWISKGFGITKEEYVEGVLKGIY